MIDLETLDTEPTALFTSIGAVIFDPATGELGDELFMRINLESAQKAGRTISASTFMWWLGQDEDARRDLMKPGDWSIDSALETLAEFIPENGVVWSNGATFDISILENAYKNSWICTPWKFWNVRDVRTICDTASHLVTRESVPFEGTKHNALADARHQAVYVSKMYMALK
jgi:exodeoxyribonuclease VIII